MSTAVPEIVDLATVRAWHLEQAEALQRQQEGAKWTADHNTGHPAGLARRRIPSLQRRRAFHLEVAKFLAGTPEHEDQEDA